MRFVERRRAHFGLHVGRTKGLLNNKHVCIKGSADTNTGPPTGHFSLARPAARTNCVVRCVVPARPAANKRWVPAANIGPACWPAAPVAHCQVRIHLSGRL